MSTKLSSYYQEQFSKLKENYRDENEISFINSLEEIVTDTKNILLKSRNENIQKFAEIDISNSQSRDQLIKSLKKTHNNKISFNQEMIAFFIKMFEPCGMEFEIPQFKEFEI